MKPTTYRVSLGYVKMNDDSLLAFATGVHAKLYAQPAYSAPPVAATVLLAAITALSEAKVAQANGGKEATAAKNLRREELLVLLKRLAFYVQLAFDNLLPVLLASGFDAASTNRTPVVLAKPTILRIQAGLSGEALVTVTPDRNARSYEVRVAELDDDNAPGPFRPAVTRTGSRNMMVPELVPGRLCAFQVRAVGGTLGYSDWSDVVVQRAA